MEDRLSPSFPIMVERVLLVNCLELITAAKHDRYTGGDVAGVIMRLQNTLEKAARESAPMASEDAPD